MSDLPDAPEVQAPPQIYSGFIQPESAANTTYANSQPVYPFNNVTQTQSGHLFEMDDTLDRERVRLQHRKNTFIEMAPNGDMVQKITGNGFFITCNDHNIVIGTEGAGTLAKLNITVYGDVNMHVVGDKIEQVDGNYELHVKGDMSVTSEGLIHMTSQSDTVLQCGGAIGGGLKVEPGDYMHIKGDLHTDGEIVAQKITSTGRIDALLGVGAGPQGFVTELGGVQAGPGIPLLGQVNATVSTSAPLALFGVMKAMWAFDTLNLGLHNTHIHISPKGPTGPPIPREIGA